MRNESSQNEVTGPQPPCAPGPGRGRPRSLFTRTEGPSELCLAPGKLTGYAMSTRPAVCPQGQLSSQVRAAPWPVGCWRVLRGLVRFFQRSVWAFSSVSLFIVSRHVIETQMSLGLCPSGTMSSSSVPSPGLAPSDPLGCEVTAQHHSVRWTVLFPEMSLQAVSHRHRGWRVQSMPHYQFWEGHHSDPAQTEGKPGPQAGAGSH
uniref:Uncharacterized protein n=1 Tax=Rousettus aegyptiacus TaxID=9407 RepID=A0A7J8B9Q4_ROUAE|nr:hypothetical protein HJG63_009979 [Rousettus aegyptiacus]